MLKCDGNIDRPVGTYTDVACIVSVLTFSEDKIDSLIHSGGSKMLGECILYK